MPKDTNKENVPPGLRPVQKRKQSDAVVAALSTRTQPIAIHPGAPTSNTSQPPRNAITLPSFAEVLASLGLEGASVKPPAPSQCVGQYCFICDPRPPARAFLIYDATNPYSSQPQTRPEFPHLQVMPQVQTHLYGPAPGHGGNQGFNPLSSGIWPIISRPLLIRTPKYAPLRQLDVINQFYTSSGIWPLSVQTHLEHDLHNKVSSHWSGKRYIGLLQICQISTSFKIGTQQENGFRWAILILPYLGQTQARLQELELVNLLQLTPPAEEFAWLLDPCAPMEGRDMLEYLNPDALMSRRRHDLRPRLYARCQGRTTFEELIRRMEDSDSHWRDVLCCSVAGAEDPRSLALGTGLWATAVHQLAYGAPLFEYSPAIAHTKNLLGSELESMGSRELGLAFLHPARLENPSYPADSNLEN